MDLTAWHKKRTDAGEWLLGERVAFGGVWCLRGFFCLNEVVLKKNQGDFDFLFCEL